VKTNRGTGSAPGKMILLGEHAVVYGQPAIALPVFGRRAKARVTLNDTGEKRLEVPRIRETQGPEPPPSDELRPLVLTISAALEHFGAPERGVTARLQSTIPIGAGMGSSAAAAVALVRALAAALRRDLSHADLVRLAMVAERGFHGKPSGVDVEVVAREAPVFYVPGKGVEPVCAGHADFHWALAHCGIGAPTAAVVRDVARRRLRKPKRYDRLFGELGRLTRAARRALQGGGPEDLGPLMDQGHALLAEIGVSCPELDALVAAAREAGALGAKLSGAGRGGHIIALAPSRRSVAAIEAACRRAGAVETCRTSLARARTEVAP